MNPRGGRRIPRALRGLALALLVSLMAAGAGAQVGDPLASGDRTDSLELGNANPAQALSQLERARQLRDRNVTLLGAGAVDPDTYVLGPGDLLRMEVRGALSLSAPAIVSADGSVTFPQLGTLDVGGRTLTAARAAVSARAGKLISGAEVSLILDTGRAFKVQVVGEVPLPGAVAATALTRVSEAIQAAGGPGDSASVRRIVVRHTDGTQTPADLLGFLLAGRMAGNPTLRDGDVVVVPPRADLVSVEGAVLYPGSYDYVPADELGALLTVIGLRPDADRGRALIQRTPDDRAYDTLGVALGPVLAGTVQVPLRPGDRVLVHAVGDWRPMASASVEGAVVSPGPVPVERGSTRVKDAVAAAGGLGEAAVAERVILTRFLPPDTTAIRHPAEAENYLAGLAARGSRETVVDLSLGAGPLVEPGDRIMVPRRVGWVQLAGRVKRPGFYDYRPGWEVSQYITAAGGYGRQADKSQARVSRGAADEVLFAADVPEPAPGDLIWVPEKEHGNFWQTARDVLGVTSTLATIFFVIRGATK